MQGRLVRELGNRERKGTRAFSRGLVYAALFLLLLPALPTTIASAGTYTVTRFGSGFNTSSLYFDACPETTNTTTVKLPFDANVSQAGLTVSTSDNLVGKSGWLSFDVGGDGSEGDNATLNATTTSQNVNLTVDSWNAYIAAANLSSGNITIPVNVTSCPPASGWNITLSALSVTYSHPTGSNVSAPVFSGSIGDFSLKVNTTNLYMVYLPNFFSDADGDTLNYTVVKGNPSDAGWSNVTASVTSSYLGFASSNNWTGNLTVSVNGTDPANQTASSNVFNLQVYPNRAPVFNGTIQDFYVAVGTTRTINVVISLYFYDSDSNDTAVYSITKVNPSDPGWSNVTVNVSTGRFVVSSTGGWTGNLSFRVRDTDGGGAWAESNNVTLSIDQNRPPYTLWAVADILVGRNATAWSQTPITEPDYEPITVTLVATDPNATGWYNLTVSGVNSSTNLSYFSTYAYFYVTSYRNWSGTVSAHLRLVDTGGHGADSNTFNITVNGQAQNDADIPDQTIIRGTTNYALVNLSLYLRDPEGDALTYTAFEYSGSNNSTTPITVTVNGSFLDIASVNALWTGVGIFHVRACDGLSRCTWSNLFNVTVIVQPNRAPVFTGSVPDISVIVGRSNLSAADLANYWSDADNDALTYGFTKADPNATGWQYATLSLNGTLVDLRVSSVAWTGDLVVAFYGYDPSYQWAWSNNVTLHLLQRDLVPTFSGSIENFTIAINSSHEGIFDADDYFTDPNGFSLSYDDVGHSLAPGWGATSLSWNGSLLDAANDGTSAWTGTLCFTVQATDVNGSTADSNEVCISVVAPANAPPAPKQALPPLTVLAGGPTIVVDLKAYYTDDQWPDLLQFDVVKGPEPEWADVDLTVSGGVVTVVFLAPVPPSTLTFEVVVTDVWGSAYTSPAIDLVVQANPANHAPQVAGPSSVTLALGALVDVQLQAFDDDGDAITWQLFPSAPGLTATVDASAKRMTLSGALLDERSAFEVVVRVFDGWGASSETRVAVVVWDPSHQPAITLSLFANRAGDVWVNGTVALGAQPAGAPRPPVSISLEGGAPLFATLSADRFAFLWPAALPPGERSVVVAVEDGYGRTAEVRDSVLVPEPLPPVPALTGILINGGPAGTVDYGEPLTFIVLSDAPIPASVTITWFLDDHPIGEGTVLRDVLPETGTHTLMASASNGEAAKTATTSFTVRGIAQPPRVTAEAGSPVLLYGAIFLGLAAFGLFSGLTQTGRYFIAWSLLGSVFARLKRESLLDHFVRGRLYQVISDNPGIHLAELRRRTSIAHGTAIHHLHVLEKGNYIRAVPSGALTRFYPTDQPFADDSYGLNDSDRAVLSVVASAPGISPSELSLKLEQSPSTVSRSVSRLETLGYVMTEQQGQKVAIFPRPGARTQGDATPAWAKTGE